MAADEGLIAEALRRGLIDEDEARRQLGMTHPAKTEQRSFTEDLVGHGKAALTGAADAVTGTIGFPGWVQEQFGKLPIAKHSGMMTPKLPTREAIKGWFGEQTGGSLYKPETIGEKYTRSGVEGMVSFLNPMNPMAKAAPLIGLASGVAGQAGEEFSPESPHFGRLLGESPFLAMALAVMGKKPQSAKMMGDWAALMGEDKIRAGAARAATDSDTLGAKVMLNQAMPENPIMETLLELAKTHPKGTKIQDLLLAQREATKAKTLKMAQDMSPKNFTQDVANDIVGAATRGSNKSIEAAIEDVIPSLGGPTGAPIDQMFTKGMRKSGTATFDQMTGKLNSMDSRDVREVATTMGLSDRTAFPTLVKKTLKDGWDKAQATDPMNVPKLWRGPKGTEQAARFDAMVEEAAKANKLDPKEANAAANALMDAVETASRGQGTGAVGKNLIDDAGSTLLSSVLKSVGINAPFHRIGYSMDKRNANRVVEGFIDAMTSEDMMRKMIELSRFNNAAHKTKAVARALLSAGIQDQPR